MLHYGYVQLTVKNAELVNSVACMYVLTQPVSGEIASYHPSEAHISAEGLLSKTDTLRCLAHCQQPLATRQHLLQWMLWLFQKK